MASEVLKVRRNIFGDFRNVRKSSENRRKSLEVAGTFSEIPRQKSLLTQKKVGRYSVLLMKSEFL